MGKMSKPFKYLLINTKLKILKERGNSILPYMQLCTPETKKEKKEKKKKKKEKERVFISQKRNNRQFLTICALGIGLYS